MQVPLHREIDFRSHRRTDIQQLRGLAVLAVVINHVQESWLPGGYLGVDVFFVISGYVISLSILTDRSAENSRSRFFIRFWVRRAFRLWPLHFSVVVTTTTLLAVTGLGRSDSIVTGLSSLIGIANFRLIFGRLDYFALDTGSDWFMHTWSLAVEEQSYLVLSAIFALTACSRHGNSERSFRLFATLIGTLVLASLFTALAPFTTELVRFYSPWTRFYQIGSGVLLALWATRESEKSHIRLGRQVGPAVYLGILGIVLLFRTEATNGILASLIITILTAGVIGFATAEQRVDGLRGLPYFKEIGNCSYALYLVHWPAQLFASSISRNAVMTLLISTTLSIALTVVGYRFVEGPSRSYWRSLRLRRSISFALSALLLSSSIVSASYYYVDRGLHSSSISTPSATCNWSSSVLLVGDSHLDAIRNVLVDLLDGNCSEIGRGWILDYKDLQESPSNQRPLEIQLVPIQGLIDKVSQTPPKLILVTYFLTGYLGDPNLVPDSADFVAVAWRDARGESVTRQQFISLFERQLSDLTAAAAGLGTQVVVTSPPPDFNWLRYQLEEGSCQSRIFVSRECATLRREAQITRVEYNLRSGEIHRVLDRLQVRFSNFLHLPLYGPFCDESVCTNFANGLPTYKDDDHLNDFGAELLTPKLRELRTILVKDAGVKLTCTSGKSVYSCQVTSDDAETSAMPFTSSFVDEASTTTKLEKLTHRDDYGNDYCVTLWKTLEITFLSGVCK